MRSTTTGRRAVAIAVLATLGWGVAASGSAGAATEVSELGWWSRNPLSSAPEGGFAVGASPDGPSAVAAMRMDLGGGVDTLVLEVQPTADAVALASLEVCVAPDTWTAATQGAFADAPITTCEGDAVPFARAGEGWRADVSSLVTGSSGVVSLGVVPTPGSGTVPFEVTFEAPTVRATGATEPATAPPSPRPSPVGSPSPAPPPAVTPTPAPAPIRVTPSPSSIISLVPATPVAAPAPAAGSTPPAAEPDDDGASSTVELATSGLLGATESSAPRWGEAMVLVLIGLAVGAGVYGVSKLSAVRAARGAAAPV